MGEETWPENVVRSKKILEADGMMHVQGLPVHYYQLGNLGGIVQDGPRPIICADCGTPILDGLVVHMKPEIYAVTYMGEAFYLERHIGVSCGCAAKRGIPGPPEATESGVRTMDQETSRELHVVKDVLNTSHPGDFIRSLFEAFTRADHEHFDFLQPVIRSVIDEYGYTCTCSRPPEDLVE